MKIHRLDPRDQQEFIEVYTVSSSLALIMETVKKTNDVATGITNLQKLFLSTDNTEMKQIIYATIGDMFSSNNNDLESAKKYYQDAVALAPTSDMGKYIQKFIERRFGK